MNKVDLYKKLDIDSPEEFKFFENLSALIEEEDLIEEDLIRDLFNDIDKELLLEYIDQYFEDIMRHLPDEESELYITFDSIARVFSGMITLQMTEEEIDSLAFEFIRFRKWFTLDSLVLDRNNDSYLSIRDAVFNIIVAKFIDNEINYDFSDACEYPLEGYEVRLSSMI